MTPERKFNQDVWWILQEIRKEQLATPKGEKVYFSLRPLPKTSSIRRKDVDYDFPQADTQRKLLYKLKEWKAFDLEEKSDSIFVNDFFNPPTKFDLIIHQPKFDEIYNKFKNHFFPPKKVISNEVILPPLVNEREEFISDLYKNAKNSQRSCKVYLGGIDDEYEELEEVLNDLEKRKIISYKIKVKDMDVYRENGNTIPYEIIEAEIKLNPEKLINYIKKLWETKKIIIEKLARYYLNLIRVIEVYFKNPQKLDNTLNKSYENLCEEIRTLIYENNISSRRLEFLYKKPFNLLFSAEKELEQKKIALKDKINSLRDFYGEIQKLLLIYDVSDRQSDEISKIENYLDEIESEGKIREKVEPEPPATKIEITKIPELKIKKSEKLSESKEKPTHIEIIEGDKIEQHGNKNTAKIKNIAGNQHSKKWFSMDNPTIWFIGTIIVAVVSLILNQLLR